MPIVRLARPLRVLNLAATIAGRATTKAKAAFGGGFRKPHQAGGLTMDQQQALREGMTVYGADGEKVGKIVAVDPGFVVVEKGFFFPTDYYIPTSAIANATEDEVYLTVAKDEALNQGWDQPLTATEGYTTGYATDATNVAQDTGYAETRAVGAEYDRAAVDVEDRVRVQVHEDQLEAVKRERELGEVRIEKDVVEEERTLDVPVTEERVRVRQVAASGEADPTAFEEGAIEVPVRGEEVELRKTARQTGAVEVEKEQVQRTERVGGTVRKEQVRVDKGTVDTEYVEDADAGATR